MKVLMNKIMKMEKKDKRKTIGEQFRTTNIQIVEVLEEKKQKEKK